MLSSSTWFTYLLLFGNAQQLMVGVAYAGSTRVKVPQDMCDDIWFVCVWVSVLWCTFYLVEIERKANYSFVYCELCSSRLTYGEMVRLVLVSG